MNRAPSKGTLSRKSVPWGCRNQVPFIQGPLAHVQLQSHLFVWSATVHGGSDMRYQFGAREDIPRILLPHNPPIFASLLAGLAALYY